MALVSGKWLWSVICGQSVLASDEVVGTVLEQATDHLKEGFLIYKRWSEDDHQAWSSKSKLEKEQKDFVQKVGKILDVCSSQAWEIFQLYLEYGYRGSISQLQLAKSTDREETALLHQVFYFHLSDSLHLLACRRHILSADSSYPFEGTVYKKLFKELTKQWKKSDKNYLSTTFMAQLKRMHIKQEVTPSQKTLSSHLPPDAAQIKASYHLSALKHQLATLLIYHSIPSSPQPSESILSLLQLAQGLGIGREFVDDCPNPQALHGHLEAIDALHSILLVLLIDPNSDPQNNELCEDQWTSRLNPLVQSLGSRPWHSAPILAWALLQGQKNRDPATAALYGRLAQRAINGGAFIYLQQALKSSFFQSDDLLCAVAAFVSISLVYLARAHLDLDRLTPSIAKKSYEDEKELDPVIQLANVCLKFEPIDYFFWNEEGLANVILPSALESFPHVPRDLLDVMTSLANTSASSASKVVDLLSELEVFTWPVFASDWYLISVSGSQCVARSDLITLPSFRVPKDTHGVILSSSASNETQKSLLVCWQLATNGWQALLSAFQMLQTQLESGAASGSCDDWSVRTSVATLRLASALLRSDGALNNKPGLSGLQPAAQALLISVSQSSEPDRALASALFEYFAEVGKTDCGRLWRDLDGCVLLPSLPLRKSVKRLKTPYVSLQRDYRAGKLRAMLCSAASPSPSASHCEAVAHLCALTQTAMQSGCWSSSVRGCVAFVAKEALPAMAAWRCASPATVAAAVEALRAALSLLHKALGHPKIDEELSLLVVCELCNGGAGSALRSVLEWSADLERSSEQPAEWPHSKQAKAMTAVAHLALSIAHRLAGQYSKCQEMVKRFFLEGSSVISTQRESRGFADFASGVKRTSHLVLTIAQFIYHVLNPRLPYLALKTLTKLAKEMNVPLVACLGPSAEGICETLVSRLELSAEDLWTKAAIMRLLSLACTSQPGLVRLFLTPPEPLIRAIKALLDEHKESPTLGGQELLRSCVGLLSSLWANGVSTATTLLRQEKKVWDALALCLSVMSKKCSMPDNQPDQVSTEIVGGILKVFALEYYECDPKQCKAVVEADYITTWIEYTFTIYVQTCVLSDDKPDTEDGDNELLSNCCQFVVVQLAKAPNMLTQQRKSKIGEIVVGSLLWLFECESRQGVAQLQLTLAQMHLALAKHCPTDLFVSSDYACLLSRVFACLRCAVMQTPASVQATVMAAALTSIAKAGNNEKTQEARSLLANSAVVLTEHHCKIAPLRSAEGTTTTNGNACSSPLCLSVSCSLTQECLRSLPEDKLNSLLQESHLVQSLLQAAVRHIQSGDLGVSQSCLHLLRLLSSRRPKAIATSLTAHQLALSISLALAAQPKLESVLVADVAWCCALCLKHEGASGLEGGASVAAVHSAILSAALMCPDSQPEAAIAAAALISALAPFHRLWRVKDPTGFELLTSACAGAVHRTTELLQHKQILEREVSMTEASDLGVLSNTAKVPTIQGPSPLVNQLLQILFSCLETVRILSPELVEIICCPGSLEELPSFDLLQSTTRRQRATAGQVTLPNMATLADVLDLYHTLLPKEPRSTSVSGSSKALDALSLTGAAEVSLQLFLGAVAVQAITPGLTHRQLTDATTFLADETSSFFSQWSGRRVVASSSSPLPPLSPKLPLPNLPYFLLCRQIVTSLCNQKKN